MKTYTKEELSKIIEQHKLWLSVEGGSRANLEDADLRGANLEDADLRGANLRGADLRGANLRGADLRGADLEGANLRGADLRGADLEGADLRGANLGGADLGGADLQDADLRGADLWGANGNMDQMKSLFIEEYPVTYTSEVIQIGCQRHKIDDWWSFDDERIIGMDGKRALKFWRKYKDFIKMAIELSPATPTRLG